MSVRADDVECVVRGAVKRILGAEMVEAAGDDALLMRELGVDSLELVELLAEIGRQLRLDLSLPALSRHLGMTEVRGDARASDAAAAVRGHWFHAPITVRSLAAYACAAAAPASRAGTVPAGRPGAERSPLAI